MLTADLVASVAFGSLLGMRHALEPDHLAAVSTLVNEERSSYRAALLGAYWGVGHTTALFGVGSALVVLGAELPMGAYDLFEVAVALMLIALGLRAMASATKQDAAKQTRVHRSRLGWMLARRPLLFGLVHGLAGSGALTALVLTALPSTATRLTYISLFGIGSTLGMACLSGLLGWPMSQAGRQRGVGRSISMAVGILSTALGIVKGYPVVAQLF